jgi:soluble lytic murein transglycosylase-like protein
MYPYPESEVETDPREQQHKLQRLVEDPLYWREQDPEFRSYVDNGFKAVYGNDEAENDATGRTIDPAPKAVTLPPFQPSVASEDVNLAGGVGENQPNRWRDVWKVQKGLSKTGHYALDLTNEKSGEHSPTLGQAIRNFQREKREEIDGVLLPGGPTIKRIRESLFGAKIPGARASDASQQQASEAAENLLTKVLSPLFASPNTSSVPKAQSLAQLPNANDEGVVPAQETRPGSPTSDPQRRRSHREAEDRSMERLVPYRVIDLPDGSPSARSAGPILFRRQDRKASIIANTPGRIVVKENPDSSGEEPLHAFHAAGQAAVELFDPIIRREAARLGVDANLVRAIMYVENAQGQYGKPFEGVGAKSILPMNIRYDTWAGLGFSERDFFDATMNIRAGATLIRRILDRLDEPTVSKVATLYNSLPKDSVSDYGARVAEVYRARAWERKDRRD